MTGPSPASRPLAPAEVAAALGGTVQAHRTGPATPPPTGRVLDPSDMTLKDPCPSCGQPTVSGWRARDESGRWGEVRFPPTPCLDCRVAHALAGEPVWTERPRGARLDGGRPAAWWGGPAPAGAAVSATESAPGAQDAGGADRAAWTVQGRSVVISRGTLTVDGRPVAEGVDPATVTVYGGRLFVAGRPVADLSGGPPHDRR